MVVSHCDHFQIISLACVVRAFIKFIRFTIRKIVETGAKNNEITKTEQKMYFKRIDKRACCGEGFKVILHFTFRSIIYTLSLVKGNLNPFHHACYHLQL